MSSSIPETAACWAARESAEDRLNPLKQRMCRVVMYARRGEMQAQASGLAELKGFMPEVTDPEQRFHKAMGCVLEIWFYLGPQKDS